MSRHHIGVQMKVQGPWTTFSPTVAQGRPGLIVVASAGLNVIMAAMPTTASATAATRLASPTTRGH